jgi:hypothetical protein
MHTHTNPNTAPVRQSQFVCSFLNKVHTLNRAFRPRCELCLRASWRRVALFIFASAAQRGWRGLCLWLSSLAKKEFHNHTHTRFQASSPAARSPAALTNACKLVLKSSHVCGNGRGHGADGVARRHAVCLCSFGPAESISPGALYTAVGLVKT